MERTNKIESMLPENISKKLSGITFQREDRAKVISALDTLPFPVHDDFREFFERFRGPLGNDVIGYQLLDLVEERPCILTATAELRKRFALPQTCLVLSDLLAGGLLIYDCENDAVFDVDFEGGFDAFIRHKVTPRWDSFTAFLKEFLDL